MPIQVVDANGILQTVETLPSKGQATSDYSLPVVLSSNQPAIPVTSSLPAGAATDAKSNSILLAISSGALTASGISPVTGSFTSVSASSSFTPLAGRNFNITISGTFNGTVQLERSFDGTTFFPLTSSNVQLCVWTSSTSIKISDQWSESEVGVSYRLNATAFSSGTATYRISQ